MSDFDKVTEKYGKKRSDVFASNPKWAKYNEFFDTHSKAREFNTYEFNFATNSKGEKYQDILKSQIEPLILSGDQLAYLAVGNQSIPLDKEEINDLYNSGDGKNFNITGWRYDEDNGLVVGAVIGKGVDSKRIEIRNYSNLNSYIVGEGHETQFNLNQVKQLNDGFNQSFGQESIVGWKGKNADGTEVDYTFPVKRLLYDKGPYKEGEMQVDFGEGTKSFSNEADLINEYLRVMSTKQQQDSQFKLLSDEKGVIVYNTTDAAKDANNPYGLGRSIGKQFGFNRYDTLERGLEVGKQDVMNKVLGNSGTMKGKFGDNYTATATLRDLVNTYVTWGHEGNNPDEYVNDIANWLGVSPNVALSQLSSRADEVAKWFLRKESPSTFNKIYGQDNG